LEHWSDHNRNKWSEHSESASKTIKTVISNVFQTATLADGVFDFSREEPDRSLYYLCQLKAVAPSLINFNWKDAVQQFASNSYDNKSVDDFVRQILRVRRRLRQQYVIPPSGNAIHFNHAMPHAYTCKPLRKEPIPVDAERRRRVMLDVSLTR